LSSVVFAGNGIDIMLTYDYDDNMSPSTAGVFQFTVKLGS